MGSAGNRDFIIEIKQTLFVVFVNNVILIEIGLKSEWQ